MALRLPFHKEHDMVLVKGNSFVKELILNRPHKLNSLNYEMISRLGRAMRTYENDSMVKLIIMKGNGKAFCAGGDVVAVITSSLLGHWSFVGRFYRTQLHLDYLVATYKKPVVSIIDGVVMGAGAGLSMNTNVRVVTEKAVFAMPEASIGLIPDVGASYFLSRLPGYFGYVLTGSRIIRLSQYLSERIRVTRKIMENRIYYKRGEYLGLTGSRLNGAEMVACGLATHFVPSKKLHLLEKELLARAPSDASIVARIIDKFAENPSVKQDSSYNRLEIINLCFSRDTVEEILQYLENEARNKTEKWIVEAIKSMKSSSPSSLKLFLRTMRGGKGQNLQQCLAREYHAIGHIILRSFGDDFYEGSRAKLFDKDNKPKWKPSDLELVTKPMLDRYFNTPLDEEYWEPLDFLARTCNLLKSRL